MSYPSFTVRQSVIPYLCSKAQQATGGFPVRRAYCVGQNYAGHAKEMGAVPRDKSTAVEPFFFGKHSDCIFFPQDGLLPFPSKTHNLQFEGELVLAIGLGGSNISPEDAYRHVCGYAVGLDMTRRDIQQAAKSAGRPWDFAKSFDFSGPMSPIQLLDPVPKSNADLIHKANISTTVNGVVKQSSNINDMITDIPHIISFLSQYIALQPGDVIFTGTPEGVGTVNPGDEICVAVEGAGELKVKLQ
jgi:fumarylpyruvate hydrolase